MNAHRPAPLAILPGLALTVLFAASSGFAPPAEELSGFVKSVDAPAKKIVVTPTGKEKSVDVTVDANTVIETSAGKSLVLKDLKAGDGLGIAHVGGLASKIIVNAKLSELTGHVKSVAANLKSFVVTETGTTTDVTVVVKPDTTIATTDAKKIELKELKKGDGVGISHVNSVASKIVVNVKSVE